MTILYDLNYTQLADRVTGALTPVASLAVTRHGPGLERHDAPSEETRYVISCESVRIGRLEAVAQRPWDALIDVRLQLESRGYILALAACRHSHYPVGLMNDPEMMHVLEMDYPNPQKPPVHWATPVEDLTMLATVAEQLAEFDRYMLNFPRFRKNGGVSDV